MGNLVMDKETKHQLGEVFRRLDDEMRELESIYADADKELYDLEKRIARLRRTHRA